MTDPTGGAPIPPQAPVPPQGAYTPPPPAGAPVPPPAGGNWNAPPPGGAAPGGFNPNFQQVVAEAGPAPGVVYADIANRAIAAVITLGNLGVAIIVALLFGAVAAAVNAVYFIYGWTKLRASLGQKFLNLQTVSAVDGSTLTQNQAIKRWLYLWGPYALAQIIPVIGLLVLLLAVLYLLYILYTISQNPKRQGFHDVQAGTVVVKHV